MAMYLKIAALIGMAFLILATCSSPEPVPSYEEYLREGLEKGFPGIIIGVWRLDAPSPWIGAKGYSSIELQRKMSKEDVFPVGSVTKLVTAIATLKLIEQGKLSLHTKVAGILKDPVVLAIPYIQEIEIHHLLNHTSGIYSSNNDMKYIGSLLGEGSVPYKRWSSLDLLALSDSARVAPFGQPDTGTYYGDANYILLELVITALSGKPFREFVSVEVLLPLGLVHTGYFGVTHNKEQVEIPATTEGYIRNSEVIQSIIKISDRFPRVHDTLINTTTAVDLIDGASALVSDAPDQLKLAAGLFKGDLLSAESLAYILAPGKTMSKDSIGSQKQAILEVYKRQSGIVYVASGDGPSGFHSLLAYEPAHAIVVLMFVNIFGLFNEKDSMLGIIDGILLDEGDSAGRD